MKRILLFAVLALSAATWLNLSAGNVDAAAIKSLAGCGDNTLGAIDDRPSAEHSLAFAINYFGITHNSVWVNNNGNVTFGTPLSSYTPFDLTSTSTAIIAPFFGDVDTRGDGSGTVTYGNTSFGGRPAFCVNWINVGYFSSADDKLNSFQLIIVDRSDVSTGDFDMYFNYNQIQWETGNASGGDFGLGGSSARAGYSNGIDTSLELPGSAVNGAFLDSSPSGLTRNNRGSVENGRYVFPVRSGVAPTGGTISGRIFGDPDGTAGVAGAQPLNGSVVQACFFLAEPVTPCDLTTTNSQGEYIFSGLEGNGNYFITAFPPTGSELGSRRIGALFLAVNGVLLDQDITLIPTTLPPPNVTVVTPFVTAGGTPAISSTTGAPVVQDSSCTGGFATFTLTQGGVVLASGTMVESPPGTYTGTIPPLPGINGRARLNITIDCPGGGDKDDTFDVYIDPSGNVYHAGTQTPIAGATVTLYRAEAAVGPFVVVPDGSPTMSPSNRTNPDLTNVDGFFRWDVAAGYYKVRAEKAGCVDPSNAAQPYTETIVYEIPPPVFDIEMFLDCGGAPSVTDTPVPPTNTPVPPTSTPTSSGGDGDVNCDGNVNSIDAALVLQFIAGLLPSFACPGGADVNESGDVNSIDTAIILQFSAGFIPSLPV